MGENKYILKVGNRYITEGDINFGLPVFATDFRKAKIFSQKELKSFLQIICLRPTIIEI